MVQYYTINDNSLKLDQKNNVIIADGTDFSLDLRDVSGVQFENSDTQLSGMIAFFLKSESVKVIHFHNDHLSHYQELKNLILGNSQAKAVA